MDRLKNYDGKRLMPKYEHYLLFINDRIVIQEDILQLDWTSNMSRQQINLSANQKGYDTFETTVGKLSARRIQIFRVHFCVIHFPSFSK